MKKLLFSHAEFITSTLSDTFPMFYASRERYMPEIAVIGKSNVGKSSLLNHLFKQKLARVSATPGKTQLLNFYKVDDGAILVDLPGYGYAKVPFHLKKKWSHCLEAYFQNRMSLKLILLLIDIRRTPTIEDLSFVKWAYDQQKPFLIVFTKTDQVNLDEKKILTETSLKKIEELLPRDRRFSEGEDFCLNSKIPHVHYSIKEPESRSLLIDKIHLLLNKPYI